MTAGGDRRLPRVAVGAIVVDDGDLLLVRRKSGAAAGFWAVPGGHVEWGESAAAAVEREVLEETGLAVRCRSFAGWVERISPTHHYVIMDFMAEVADGADRSAVVAGDDASEVMWCSIGDLDEVDLVEGLLDFLEDVGVVGQTD